jgi:hypothetical protein
VSTLIDTVQVTGLATGGATLLYAWTVTVVAVTAIAARTSERRRDARAVLRVLLPRRRR